MLIEHGHNTEFRNPYRYSIRDLVATADRLHKQEKAKLVADSVVQHTSRIAIAASDNSVFEKLVKDLQQ